MGEARFVVSPCATGLVLYHIALLTTAVVLSLSTNYDDGAVQRGDIPSRPSGTGSECVFGGLIPMHSGGQPSGPRQ